MPDSGLLRFFRDPRLYAALAVLALIGAAVEGGAIGIAGMLLGLTSALFGLIVLWYLIGVIGKAMTEGGNPGVGTWMTIMGVFLKVPILILAWMAAKRLGHAAPGCFLFGLVLVYFGVVAWANARR